MCASTQEHICSCKQTPTYAPAHASSHMHTHTHTCTRMHTHIRTHTCTHTHTHAHTHTCTHTPHAPTHVHSQQTHAHTHRHTHTHTHIHEHTLTHRAVNWNNLQKRVKGTESFLAGVGSKHLGLQSGFKCSSWLLNVHLQQLFHWTHLVGYLQSHCWTLGYVVAITGGVQNEGAADLWAGEDRQRCWTDEQAVRWKNQSFRKGTDCCSARV